MPETFRAHCRLPEPDDTQGHVSYHHPEITLEKVHVKAVWLMGLDPESRATVIARHFSTMYYGHLHCERCDWERWLLHYAIQRIGWQ